MTQKNKNRALVLALLALLFVAYQYGFATTIELFQEVSALKKEEALYRSAPTQLASLAKKEQQLDAVLKSNNISGSSLQNNILTMLNTTSQELRKPDGKPAFNILAFESPHRYKDEGTGSTVTTHDFALEGGYKALVRTVYLLEQQYSFGNVVHVGFNKKKDFKTAKSSLQCNVLLQYIK